MNDVNITAHLMGRFNRFGLRLNGDYLSKLRRLLRKMATGDRSNP